MCRSNPNGSIQFRSESIPTFGQKAMHRWGRTDYRSHCGRVEPHSSCRSYLVQRRSARHGILSKIAISRSSLSTSYWEASTLTIEITSNTRHLSSNKRETKVLSAPKHHELNYRGTGAKFHVFFTSVIGGGEWSFSHPSLFISEETAPR
jgi:hypothetical protein